VSERPFDARENLVITTRQVMNEGWPILVVTHDLDDEGWQFVNGHGDTDDAKNGMLVHPEHLVQHDPSVISLADLPLVGWRLGPIAERPGCVARTSPPTDRPSRRSV